MKTFEGDLQQLCRDLDAKLTETEAMLHAAEVRTKQLEAAIMKISGIIKREDFGATPWVKNFQDLGTAIGEAEKLVGAGR